MNYFSSLLIATFLFLGFASTVQAQEKEVDFSVRASGHYQLFSFSGARTNSSVWGGVLEKRISYESTIGLNINYATRTEDSETQRRNIPQYQNVFNVGIMARRYFDIAFSGPYAGIGLGMGFPSETGVAPEIGGHFGYQVVKKNLAIDFNIQTGFGSYRYSENRYDNFGTYQGNVYYRDYGFFFRPGISIGIAR
ncbi:hypothetical protein KFE98_07005 [bacterium SCSIO 12741]|nr:hypothetical protein KFE98_07005 [bacterium SCSIO 12741]